MTNNPVLLHPREVAKRLQISLGTLANMRWRGTGPKFVKIGNPETGRVRYLEADLVDFINALPRKAASVRV